MVGGVFEGVSGGGKTGGGRRGRVGEGGGQAGGTGPELVWGRG